MVANDIEHKQLTLMFTDIVGYSRMMGRDEATTIALLGEYRRILLARIEQNQGILIEFVGDAVFARFDNPLNAVNAGIEIQKDLGEFNTGQPRATPLLQSRIGIHMGEVAIRGKAVFGDDVNIAARLEPIAVAGGVCVSGQVYREIKDKIREPVKPLGRQPLKNIETKSIKAYLIRPSGITVGTHIHYLLRKSQQKINAYRYPLTFSAALLIAAGIYFIPRWLVPGYDANYVEIADFQNLMQEQGNPDYFSAGITEALRSQLADIRDVYIIEAGKGIFAPIRLEGSIQRVGDQLRIAYRLFRRKDNVQIAGGKLDASYSDIFILQDRVVAEIAGYLAEEFGLRNFRPAALRLTSDVTAYDYYLQGLDYLKRPVSHDNTDSAIKMFSTALTHDANFALANTGLCRTYMMKYSLTKIKDWVNKAEIYCNRALKLDDTLSETYEALGKVYRDTGQYDESVAIFKKALAIDSNNVDAMLKLAHTYKLQNKLDLAEHMLNQAATAQPKYWRVYHEYGDFYANTGDMAKAVEYYKKVLELTPENSLTYANLGATYTYIGNFEKAADAFENAVKIVPDPFSYSNAGTMYYLSGNYRKAAEMYREAIKLSPDDYRWYVNYAGALRQLPQSKAEAQAMYNKAIDMAHRVLDVNSSDVEIYQYLIESYLFTDQMDKARVALDKVLELNSTDINVLYIRLKYWTKTKNFDKATDISRELINSGYTPDLIEADPDLKDLVDYPEYQKLKLAMQSN